MEHFDEAEVQEIALFEIIEEIYKFMETVARKAVNPDTGQRYQVEMPVSQFVRQAILELDFTANGITVKEAAPILAEKFELSDEQKRARNTSNYNLFRHSVVSPQFKRLLEESKLEQPGGARTPYFLARSSNTNLAETSPEYEETPFVETVERTAVDSNTGEEYQIKLPATPVVKQALLDFDYPASGIKIRDVAEALADQFALTDDQRNAKGYYGLVWRHHVNITANTLVNSGQLLRIKIGWIIHPEQLDVDPSEADSDSPFSDGDTPSPEVAIEQNYRDHRNSLKAELLQKIIDNPPEFFEELVLDLLVKMGYGGSRADAEAVGRSGDGGIDGIIKQDQLGLDAIYVQAKRWGEGAVGSPDIYKFSGALTCQGASKGVFITTSNFSDPAKEAANESAGPKLILIDGDQLVQLMIDHNLGVSLGNFYQLKEVNLNYFTIDDDVDRD